MITRRSLITGTTALLAAPAIVRAESIMPVRSLRTDLIVGPDLNAYEVVMRWSEEYASAYGKSPLACFRDSIEQIGRIARQLDQNNLLRQSATHK